MLDQLANYLEALWAYVLREPLKVLLVLGLVVPVVLIGVNNLRESSRQRSVETELPQLVERIKKARVGSNLVLGEMTGDFYSDGNAKCRKGQSLRSLAADDACIVGMTAQWQKLGFEDLPRDPWGSPYLFDENEMEGGGCEAGRYDVVFSAGPNGIDEADVWNDDVHMLVPPFKCP